MTVKMTSLPNKPFRLNRRDEEILKAVSYYRYMTAVDITKLLGYAYPASRKYVGRKLTRLAGGSDYQERTYLYRFPMPDTRVGNTERIFTLGALGRSYMQEELGITVDWYFRPHKTRELTYSHLLHPLAVTRFLIAAQILSRTHPQICLKQIRIDYELRQTAALVATALPNQAGKTEQVSIKVVPDAWLNFALPAKAIPSLPILLEIDRGTEQQAKFKQHIASRLVYVKRGGFYQQQFGTEDVTIAYATTGSRQRQETMLHWTEEVIRELNKPAFAPLFHFVSLPKGELDPDWLFLSPAWRRPFESHPVPLLV